MIQAKKPKLESDVINFQKSVVYIWTHCMIRTISNADNAEEQNLLPCAAYTKKQKRTPKSLNDDIQHISSNCSVLRGFSHVTVSKNGFLVLYTF